MTAVNTPPSTPPRPPHRPDEALRRDRGEDSSRRRPGRGAIAAAVFLLAAAIVVPLVVFSGGHHASQPKPPQPSVQPSSQPTSQASATAQPLDTAVPTRAPATEWQLFEGEAVPTAPGVGPSESAGAAVFGWAHTPTGALFAAAQINLRLLVAPGTSYDDVIDHCMVQDSGAAALRKQLTGVNGGADDNAGQIAAFGYVAYTSDTAVVDLVKSFTNGEDVLQTVTMRWVDNDWRMQLQADGSLGPTPSHISSTAGFIAWSGED